MKKLVAVVVVLCFGLPSLVTAEVNFTYVDETRVEIGMPEADVMAQLSESHRTKKVQESGSASSYLVWQKEGCGVIASLHFRNGKLERIVKDRFENCGDDGADPRPFIKALQQLLTEFQREGRTSAVISASERKNPTGNIIEIEMRFGDKSIEIHFVEGIADAETGKTRDTFPELQEVFR